MTDQDADREPVTCCESCGKPIYPGDMFQPGGEVDLCPEHAATLGDEMEYIQRDIADTSDDPPAWSYWFATIEDAQKYRDGLRAQIAIHGADFKVLVKADA